MRTTDDPGAGPEPTPVTPHERRLRSLLSTLHARTMDESLTWEVDDAHPDSYCVGGQRGWMIATRSVDGDGQGPYALVIGGPSGEAILEVDTRSPFARPMTDLFTRLHAAAAASASLAAQAPLLAAIIDDLASPHDEPARSGRMSSGRQGD